MDRTSSSTHFGHGGGNSGVPRNQRGGTSTSLSASISAQGVAPKGLVLVVPCAWLKSDGQFGCKTAWQRTGSVQEGCGGTLGGS